MTSRSCIAPCLVRFWGFVALSILCAPGALASGLTSGHYQFQVRYSPICLNGVYPVTVGKITTGSVMSVNLDVSGNLSGTLDVRTILGPASGTLTFQNNVVSLHLHTSGQDPTQTMSDIDAQLHATQFIGTVTANNQSGLCTMDVSAAAPLKVTFDLDLVVSQGSVTGNGIVSGCANQVPVNVTGATSPRKCTLHIVGVDLPQFRWDASGHPTATGFTASWVANGFGASVSGAGLAIVAPAGTPSPTPSATPTIPPRPRATPKPTPTPPLPTPTPRPSATPKRR
jgi:hypothetical protein